MYYVIYINNKLLTKSLETLFIWLFLENVVNSVNIIWSGLYGGLKCSFDHIIFGTVFLFPLTYLNIKWQHFWSHVQEKSVQHPRVSPFHISVERVLGSKKYFKLFFFWHFAVILVSSMSLFWYIVYHVINMPNDFG